MGPYPIDMARHVFASEPEEVVALDASAAQEIGPPLKRPQPMADQVVRLDPVATPELVDAAPPEV